MSILSSSGAGGDFDIMAYAASGMEAQRGALQVAARNVALAQTATPDHPVKAYAPMFGGDANAIAENPFASLVKSASDGDDSLDLDGDGDSDGTGDTGDGESGAWGAATGGVGTQGLVAMTGVRQTNVDINPITQMIDVINAQRAFESNASVFETGKTLASKMIDLVNTQ